MGCRAWLLNAPVARSHAAARVAQRLPSSIGISHDVNALGPGRLLAHSHGFVDAVLFRLSYPFTRDAGAMSNGGSSQSNH